MDIISPIDYGSLGAFGYDSLQRKWCSVNCTRRLNPVEDSGNIVDEVEIFILADPHQSSSKNQIGTYEISSVASPSQAHSIPGVAPCANIVSEFLYESDIITKASSLRDTLTGDLVAKGSAKEVDSRSYETPSKHIPVIAFVTGMNGGDLSILDISQTHAFDEMGASVLQNYKTLNPVLKFRLPIYQICFAELNTKRSPSPFFAVRTPSGTSLFVLTYKKWPTNKDFRGFNALHIGDIGNNMTAGPQHAHVAFSPWFDRQLVIIDIKGNWSTWTIKGRYSEIHSTYSLCPHASGVTKMPLVLWEGLKTVRIIWGKDVNTLIVSCGRQIAEISISKPSSTVEFLDILLGANEAEILEIKRCPALPSVIFVLSTFHVYWLNVMDLNVMQMWKHYRHPQDMTLNLTIKVSDNSAIFFLYSRYNRIVSIFRKTVIGSLDSVLTRNPEFLLFPFGHLMTIDQCSIESSSRPNLSKELSLILTSTRKNSEVSFGILISGFAKAHARRNKKRQTSTKYFHLCRSEKKHQHENVRSLGQVSTSVYFFEDLALKSNGPPSTTFLPQYFGQISNRIHNYNSETTEARSSSHVQRTKEEYFKSLKRLMVNYRGSIILRTVLEVYPPQGLFEEFISPSQDLEIATTRNLTLLIYKVPLMLLDCTTMKDHTCEESSFANPHALLLMNPNSSCEGSDISELTYKQAMTIWLGNMPKSVPGTIRLKKEHLSRKISQDVALASLSICAPYNANDLAGTSEQPFERSSLYLPGNINRTFNDMNPQIGASIDSEIRHIVSSNSIGIRAPKWLWNFTSTRTDSLVVHDIAKIIDDWPEEEQTPQEYTWKPIRENQSRSTETKGKKRANHGFRNGPAGAKTKAESSEAATRHKMYDRKGRHIAVGKESYNKEPLHSNKTRSSGRKGSGIERRQRKEGF